jgi:flagellar protein FlaG
MDISSLAAVGTVTSRSTVPSDRTSTPVTGAAAPAAASSFPAKNGADQTPPTAPAELVAQLKVLLQSSPQTANAAVTYGVDAKSGVAVVSIRDGQTGKLIRQMPPEDVLKLLQASGTGASALLDSHA